METASKVEAVSMARSVSKEGSFEDVLGSIDNLSPEDCSSENSFEVSLLAVFSDTNEASTEASPKVSSEEFS